MDLFATVVCVVGVRDLAVVAIVDDVVILAVSTASATLARSDAAPSFDFESLLKTLDALSEATLDASATTAQPSLDASFAAVLAQHGRLMEWIAQTLAPHAERQTRVEAARARVDEATQAVLRIVAALREKQAQIETLLAEAERRRQRRNEAAPLDHAQIINYARRLAKYTSPPSNPKIPAIPPIPQDAHMKRSMLYAPLLESTSEAANGEESNAQAEVVLMDLSVLKPFQSSADQDEVDEDELNLDL
ncbi:hypothetical protein BC830DRAFT_1173440 [Chytriomyces sp. MP71]|nr:hypothetical protein BC830DRAFT_1173440 [Chytriomyces sp. MP71]